jgi:phospholipid N-methyltransferase
MVMSASWTPTEIVAFAKGEVATPSVNTHRKMLVKLALFMFLGLGLIATDGALGLASPAIAAATHRGVVVQSTSRVRHHVRRHHLRRHVHKNTKHVIHAKNASHLKTHVTVVSLTSNVAPSPNFMESCTAVDESPTCLNQEIAAIDNARAQEGLPAVQMRLAAFHALSIPQQLFVLTNLERTVRNLPPVLALTQQLDDVAAQGALTTGDPALNGWHLTGGRQAIAWNSNWAGGLSTLAANYYWMYSDGPGFNIDCTNTNTSGCWAHRKNILVPIEGNCGAPNLQPQFVMGAATTATTQYGPSDAEILVQECGGLPADVVFTWSQAESRLGIVS